MLYVLTKFVHLPLLSVYLISRHLSTFPMVSVEDWFYLIGVPIINGLNVLWYTQPLTMIAKVRLRCEDAVAALSDRGEERDGGRGVGERERNGHSSNGDKSTLPQRWTTAWGGASQPQFCGCNRKQQQMRTSL